MSTFTTQNKEQILKKLESNFDLQSTNDLQQIKDDLFNMQRLIIENEAHEDPGNKKISATVTRFYNFISEVQALHAN